VLVVATETHGRPMRVTAGSVPNHTAYPPLEPVAGSDRGGALDA